MKLLCWNVFMRLNIFFMENVAIINLILIQILGFYGNIVVKYCYLHHDKIFYGITLKIYVYNKQAHTISINNNVCDRIKHYFYLKVSNY